MKAIILNTPGNVNELKHVQIDQPEIQEQEVLIRVKAISVNPVDVKTRAGSGVFGRLKEELPLILGWDISGIVESSKSDTFKPGDEVFGMVRFPGHGKAYAEYVAAPASQLAHKPSNITHEAAAATTLAALTAWQALAHQAQVKAGQQVLIHGASGGVGHFAVQIAKHLGAEVTGTSSAKNRTFVLNTGADAHIDYQGYDWNQSADSYDFVLDTVGGDNIIHSIDVSKKGGTVISIPTGLSEAVSQKAESRGVKGFFMLVQSSGEDMQQLAILLEKGILKPHISQTFPFEQMAAAHLQIESGRTVGKVVVTMD